MESSAGGVGFHLCRQCGEFWTPPQGGSYITKAEEEIMADSGPTQHLH